jgi:hypothetical protein
MDFDYCKGIFLEVRRQKKAEANAARQSLFREFDTAADTFTAKARSPRGYPGRSGRTGGRSEGTSISGTPATSESSGAMSDKYTFFA